MASNKTLTILVVGESGVGKSAYIRRFVDGEFLTEHIPTQGIDTTILDFPTNKGRIGVAVIECSDIATSGKFIVDGILLMCSLTSVDSYNAIEGWYSFLCKKYPNVPILLGLNKCDRLLSAGCLRLSSIKFHQQKGIEAYPLSAKSNYNFEKPFLYLLRKALGEDTNFVDSEDGNDTEEK